MNYISDIDVHSLHFFDESSVIRTSGKRNYGSSEIGKRAIEIQPYASNATFTINLLHGKNNALLYHHLQIQTLAVPLLTQHINSPGQI